jgi:AraC family transcriptional regulator
VVSVVQRAVNSGQQTDTIQIFPRSPLLTSNSAQWNYIHLEYHHQPPYEIPASSAPQHIIAIQTEVSAPRRIDGYLDGQFQSAEFAEGDILLIPANINHLARWNTDHRFILLSLDPRYLTHIAYDLMNAGQVELMPHFLKSDQLIHQISLTLKAELESSGAEDILYVETMVHALAVHLIKHYSTRENGIRQNRGGLSKLALKQVEDYITTYLEKRLSLSELAHLVHLSASHFSFEFKRSTGLSPYQFVLQCRVVRTKKLLIQSRTSIAEIANQVGFANQGHLSDHFKRHYGVTPGEMRRRSSESDLDIIRICKT